MKQPHQASPEHHAAKWLTGIAALGVTGTTQGAFVQIDLVNNFINDGGNNLNTDLNGDGMLNDVSITSTGYNHSTTMFTPGSTYTSGRNAFLSVSGERASATTFFAISYQAQAPNSFSRSEITSTTIGISYVFNLRGAFPITFDHEGTLTNALLFVSAGDVAGGRGVSLDALVWDDADPMADLVIAGPDLIANDPTVSLLGSTENGVFTPAVPEPSGLSLLALGAAGMLTHRRRQKRAA